MPYLCKEDIVSEIQQLEARVKDPLGWSEQVISETVGRLSSRLPCAVLMVKAPDKRTTGPAA